MFAAHGMSLSSSCWPIHKKSAVIASESILNYTRSYPLKDILIGGLGRKQMIKVVAFLATMKNIWIVLIFVDKVGWWWFDSYHYLYGFLCGFYH